MDYFEEYAEGVKIGLKKATVNVESVKLLCKQNAYELSPEVVTNVMNFHEVTIRGLIDIIEGNLKVIQNISTLTGVLKHELNVEELLKAIK